MMGETTCISDKFIHYPRIKTQDDGAAERAMQEGAMPTPSEPPAAAAATGPDSRSSSSSSSRRRRHAHALLLGQLPLLALLLALALPALRSRGGHGGGTAVATAFASGGGGGGGGGKGHFPWSGRAGQGQGLGLGRRLAAVRDALEQGPYMLRQPQQQQDLVARLLAAGPVPAGEREFLVNGWRWHARSVLRDVGRFQAVARREQQQPAAGGRCV